MDMHWRIIDSATGNCVADFHTDHSISLDDALEIAGFTPLKKEQPDDPDYRQGVKEVWYDDLYLELKTRSFGWTRT